MAAEKKKQQPVRYGKNIPLPVPQTLREQATAVEKTKEGGKMGEKLNLRQASYKGLQNVKRVEKITSPKYDRLAEEANKRIRKNQLKQAKAYAEAGMYFCKK